MWYFCAILILPAHGNTGELLEWSAELLEATTLHFQGFLASPETRATGDDRLVGIRLSVPQTFFPWGFFMSLIPPGHGDLGEPVGSPAEDTEKSYSSLAWAL